MYSNRQQSTNYVGFMTISGPTRLEVCFFVSYPCLTFTSSLKIKMILKSC